jgi:hypothetical protein
VPGLVSIIICISFFGNKFSNSVSDVFTSHHLTAVKATIKQNPVFYSVQKGRELNKAKKEYGVKLDNLDFSLILI